MNLFQLGEFTLKSGVKSRFKIECDALTDDDVKALAEMIRQMIGPYRSVEGVPRGGLRLAEALKPFAAISGPHLIVDDVLTTGESMEELRRREINAPYYTQTGAKVIGAVVFSRGQHPYWIRPLFQMPECFWPKPLQR